MKFLSIFQILFNQNSVLLLNSSGRISINWNLLPSQYRNPLLFIVNLMSNRNWIFDCSKLSQVIYLTKIKLAGYWWQFLLAIVNISGICHMKFQSIPSLMPSTLTDNPYLYGLGMSLSKNLMIGLFRSNNRMIFFSKTENKLINLWPLNGLKLQPIQSLEVVYFTNSSIL